MSLAEQLYAQNETNSASYESPNVSVDVLFVITMTIIHIAYASKFTTFSFGYLKAKLEEKKSRSKWSESKLYLRAVCYTSTDTDLTIQDDDDKEPIYTKLWIQLSFIRTIIKVLIFVCCCCIFVIYLSFLLNVFYEYLVVSIVYYEDGSFLALIILPFFWFINICFMRFFAFAMMASWSVNCDCIADNIAYQQHHCALKQYAHQLEHDDSTDLFSMEASVAEHSDDTEGTVQQNATFRDHIKGFFSDYFMAVHWRLWIIFCSAIATIFAPKSSTAPPKSTDDIEGGISDMFWCQLFIRYILIAMLIWMLLYFILAIGSGIYGLSSTLPVFNEVLDDQLQDDEKSDEKWPKLKRSLWRVFCLMDAFMIKDRHNCWKQYKFTIYVLLGASGLLCWIIGSAVGNGLVRFVGIINTLYYMTQVLLICKIRGIHYLWRSDMVSLELKNWWIEHDKAATTYHATDSHAAQMISLKHTQLRALLPTRDGWYSEIDPEDEQKSGVILSVEETLDVRSEEDVLTLYTTTHTKLYNHRNRLHQERKTVQWYSFASIQIRFKLLFNYFLVIFKLYKLYWFLILPYHYEIRPLSFVSSGKSVSERFARYKYSSASYGHTANKVCTCLCHGMRGMLCLMLLIGGMGGLVYVTLQLHEEVVLPSASASINSTHSGLDVTENHYPICQTKWNANLSVFDLASLAHMAYEVEDDPDLQIMSMQELMCLYFDRIPPHDLNTTSDCSWQIMYISRASPAFIHMRHALTDTEVIFIRGTWTAQEMSQDIALFNEVALLQAASWVIPITTILPQHFIIEIVYFVSYYVEGSINKIRARFDEPLFEYSYDYLMNADHTVNALYFVGHSLGGGISQIVAAQLYHAYKSDLIENYDLKHLEIKSFSMAAPGLVWGSRKFSIDVGDLYKTSTVVNPNHDAMTGIDKTGGLTQKIECNQEWAFECHNVLNTIAELSDNCEVEQSSLIDIGIVCRIMQNRVANHADLSLQIEQLTGYGNKKILKTFCGVL
eukprot:787446_1